MRLRATRLSATGFNRRTPSGVVYAIELLLVGGGGAGGYASAGAGGGGGGGQVLTAVDDVQSGTAITVSVGAGGTPSESLSVTTTSGGITTFGSLEAYGGCGGGFGIGPPNSPSYPAKFAGVGGAGVYTIPSTLPTPTVGGAGGGAAGSYTGSRGGGGGAGSVGLNGHNASTSYYGGGLGANGVSLSITGISNVYGSGGGGGVRTSQQTPYAGSELGYGGTNAGTGAIGPAFVYYAAKLLATPGLDGFGGGGGGGAAYHAVSGASGGSGTVVVAYPDSLPALTIGAGLTYDTPATRAGYRVYRITAGSGQITFA